MYETSKEDVMKGGAYWTEQIEKAGLTGKLLPFNDVLVGQEAPGGNVEPMLRDVVLDGVKVDIYHWDYPKRDTSSHRIYIHRKERVQGTPKYNSFFGPKEQDDDMHLEANERP